MIRATLKLKEDGTPDIFQMDSLQKVFIYGECYGSTEQVQIQIEGNHDLKVLVDALTTILNSR